MTRAEMQPPDRQPLGFWTIRAGEAIRARTREALEAVDVTQPQWWVLHQLTLHPAGMTQGSMVEQIGPNESDQVVERAIAEATVQGRVEVRRGHVTLTALGREAFERGARVQDDLHTERMLGVTPEDFVTTIRVLQRTCANVGSDAWHW